MVSLLKDVMDGDKWKVFMLFTSLSELKDHPWKDKQKRELYGMPEGVDEKVHWEDWREEKMGFAKESPTVLVVGMYASKT